MQIWWTRLMVMLAAGSLVAVIGCSNGDNGQGQDPDAGDEDDAFDIDDNHYEPGDIDFRSEYQLILNEFAFETGSPGSSLNGVINNFLDQSRSTPIIVLVELLDVDADAEELLIRAGAGLHAGEPGQGEYVWDDELEEPDTAEGTIDDEGYLEADLPLLNFVATIETEDDEMKTIIPIRDIELEGQLRAKDDGSNPRIIDADLEGVIWYDEVEDVEIVLAPGEAEIALVDVLDEEEMNYVYDPDDEGLEEDNAWFMTATFSAEETEIVD